MKSLLITLVAVSLHFISFSQIQGEAVSVADGDTFTLLTDDHQAIKVRLHGIDCPEKGQAFGVRAKEFTLEYLKDQRVWVTITDTDRYGRVVGWVSVNEYQTLNEDLLIAGLAWQYLKYDWSPSMKKLETAARNRKAGLWIDKNPIAPWEYRKEKNAH